MRLSVIVAGLALIGAAAVSGGRLQATEFDAQGLELLQGRYGSAYPGYGSGVSNKVNLNSAMFSQGQQQFGLGQEDEQSDFDQDQQQFAGLGNIAGVQQMNWGSSNLGNVGTAGWGQQFAGSNLGLNNLNLGVGSLASSSMLYGGVGVGGSSFGSGGGSKKGQTTVAAPIYAESMIVPKIITQPILRPHMVTQPIVQQQLIQQPIVETRQVIQPVVRRIITQPIIRPQIYESTTVQPTLKTETTVQPHLIQQTIVTPQLQNVAMENQPIQEAPVTKVSQPVVQAPISAKKGGQGGLGGY